MEEIRIRNKRSVRRLALIGMLGALGAILMLFRFPLPFLPPFLSFDFAFVPELIGAFALGPMASILIVVVRILVQFVLAGSNSMLTGELQSFLLSTAFLLPIALLYQANKTRKGALIAMGVGTISCTIMAVITNLYLIIPFYVYLYGMSMEQIIEGCRMVNPNMNSITSMVILGIVPFNLMKCLVNSGITFIVYKHLSSIMKRYANSQ